MELVRIDLQLGPSDARQLTLDMLDETEAAIAYATFLRRETSPSSLAGVCRETVRWPVIRVAPEEHVQWSKVLSVLRASTRAAEGGLDLRVGSTCIRFRTCDYVDGRVAACVRVEVVRRDRVPWVVIRVCPFLAGTQPPAVELRLDSVGDSGEPIRKAIDEMIRVTGANYVEWHNEVEIGSMNCATFIPVMRGIGASTAMSTVLTWI